MDSNANNINDNSNPALYVRRIKLNGLNRINGNVVLNEFDNVYNVKDIAKIEEEINKSIKELKNLQLFESIDVQCIDVPEFPFLTDVIVNIKEKRMDQVKIQSSFISNDEVSINASASLLSPLGYSEKFSTSFSQGFSGSNLISLSFNKPRFMGTAWKFDVNAFKLSKDYQNVSSLTENIKGIHTSLTNQAGNLKLFYKCDLRDVVPSRGEKLFEYKASREVLEMAIPSLKSSIGIAYRSDKRDSPIVPTSGSMLEILSELAGIGGSTSFAKLSYSWQKYFEFDFSDSSDEDFNEKTFRIPGLVGGLSFNGGLLYPLERIPIVPNILFGSSSNPPLIVESSILDRFFLGGPQTLRGFDFRGIGPMAQRLKDSDNNDSVGGDIKWSAGLHMSIPFPHISLASLGARVHLFGNVGSICGWRDAGLNELFGKGVRVSFGTGLIIPTTLGRVEINYSVPLQYNKIGDRINRFQVSISKDFL